jgi:hypothetical protein
MKSVYGGNLIGMATLLSPLAERLTFPASVGWQHALLTPPIALYHRHPARNTAIWMPLVRDLISSDRRSLATE